MKARKIFLTLGILLSITSKFIQFQYGSVWGDLLILPAATFFVLAILLYLPTFEKWLKNPVSKRRAIILALASCLAVLSFQLFTMFTFGQEQQWGFLFLLPVLLFTGWGLWTFKQLMSKERLNGKE